MFLGNAHLLQRYGRTWERGNTSGAHHGVDFGAAEDIENLSEHHAGDGIEDKGHQAQGHIMMVCTVTNWSARMEKAMVMPSSSVMRLAKSFCAVSDRRLSTPHSRMRLPNIRKPTRETEAGATRAGHEGDHDGEQNAGGLGHSIGAVLHLDGPLLLVVTSLMAAGWMMGTRGHVGIGGYRDGPNVVGAQHLADQNEVGPSAAPMMPMEAASLISKPAGRPGRWVRKCQTVPQRRRGTSSGWKAEAQSQSSRQCQ